MKRRAILAVIPALFVCSQAKAAKLDQTIYDKCSTLKWMIMSYLSEEQFAESELRIDRSKGPELKASLNAKRQECEEKKAEIKALYKKMRTKSKKEALKDFLVEADSVLYRGYGDMDRALSALEMELDI